MTTACQPAIERTGLGLPVTKREAIAQVTCCVGCCCGRTDRGFPAVPVERLKAVWKEEKLNRTVRLTISGCLGPCDMANMILVMTAAGTEWFGGIDDEAVFEAVIAWPTGSAVSPS